VTYLSNSSFAEQESRAQEVRLILERTFVLAQESGNLERTEDGLWQYVGNEHTLSYNPDSDSLWMAANDESWQLGYHEQAFLSGNSSGITDEQLGEFRGLRAFLNEKKIPEAVDLRSLTASAQQAWEGEHTTLPEEQQTISAIAARLFESYVEQGEKAYQDASHSTEWFYRITVDAAVYLISRDDATLTYNAQREDAQPLSRTDVQTWQDVDIWLTEQQPVRFESLADSRAGWQGTYWEQQTIRANAILPIAEQLFAYQEQQGTLQFNEADQSYVSRIGDYAFGYVPAIDTFWIDLDGDRLVSTTDWNDNCDRESWQLRGLDHLGSITPFHVEQMQSLHAWIQVKSPQWQPSAAQQHSLINRYRHTHSKGSERSDIKALAPSSVAPEAANLPTVEPLPIPSTSLKPESENIERG
jgi:hypothetical protein